ncbi:hypothetical protein, partial [Enterobacter hormaechei]|uniref:hypothetical protein n=1 Tax=Enterobacter hormaechei TaxID=158836 RepID=UPI00387E97CE
MSSSGLSQITVNIASRYHFALLNIGRLEDPAFTIKTAVVITHYPGASAQQVEEEVTLPLE